MNFKKYLIEKKSPMFHGTRSLHLNSIKSDGLKVGSPSNKNSHGHDDTSDKIFLADDYNEAFYFISQFVKKSEPIAILQIYPEFEYETLGRRHEWVTYQDIHPKLISIWVEEVKRRQYVKPNLISIKQLKPQNINYINYDLLRGADLEVAKKYWTNN